MAFGDSHFLQFVRVAAKFLFLLLFVQNSAAIAGEVKVWSGGVFRTVLIELGPQFERATGYKPSFEFGTSPAFARQIAAGQIFDVAILLPATIDAWIKKGAIVAGSRTDIARAALGVAVDWTRTCSAPIPSGGQRRR
jgi:molybdate transport system substrate-binding protein